MKPRIVRAGLAVVAGLAGIAVAASGAAPAVAARVVAAPSCGITWGSLDRSAGDLSQAAVFTVRTGQHDCFDRLVFELDGPATGYRVSYGEAYTQGQGLPLSPYTAGGALLAVTLLEPASLPNRTGDHLAGVAGYRTLRDVVFGGSFEGYTTFAVGVRARLPFQLFVLSGPGTHSRIVLDVAHVW
ncbi:MAG: hypothetical protein QOI74_641 [Micromonosporaceae bacterium]|nr:hypothetical protein [Micromonosporaceae bacterium]MDT5035003.1 hypothetical protein [Micromonosporaceae bacterium]